MKPLLEQILQILADGQFHSGEAIAQQLKVTRATIWKALQLLSELGITLNAINRRGYQIPGGIELLQSDRLRTLLTPAAQTFFSTIEIHSALDSTNQYLLDHTELPSGSLCIAELQTQGRGRRGRVWESPYACNLYCSVLWHMDARLANYLTTLPLALGVVIARMCHQLGIKEVQLKWPNDVYVHHKKLAGILVEMTRIAEGPYRIVIGIGLNISLSKAAYTTLENAIDLKQLLTPAPSRHHITATLLNELTQLLMQGSAETFTAYLKEWAQYDYLFDQNVQIHTAQQTWEGRAEGIDGQGLLRVRDEHGKVHALHSADISVRRA